VFVLAAMTDGSKTTVASRADASCIGPQEACACDNSRFSGNPWEGEVINVGEPGTASALTLRVERLLGSSDPPRVGDEVTLQWDGLTACDDREVILEPGQRVIVLHRDETSYDTCDEYEECYYMNCDGLASGTDERGTCLQSCFELTYDACEVRRQARLGPQIAHAVLPFEGNELLIGSDPWGEYAIEEGDLELVSSYDDANRRACFERWPGEPDRPCNDTVDTGPCAVAVSRDVPRGPLLFVLIGLMGLLRRR